MGCVKTHTSGYHPQGNDLVERLNKTIVKCLSLASAKDQREWSQHLVKVTMSYNHDAAGKHWIQPVSAHVWTRSKDATLATLPRHATRETDPCA